MVKRTINCREFRDYVKNDWNLEIDDSTLFAVCAFYNTGQNMILAGPPGVGKTQTIKALADFVELPEGNYLRVQAYPGITYVDFIGDWDYPKQMLVLEALKGGLKLTPENIDKIVSALEGKSSGGEFAEYLNMRDVDRYFRKGPAVMALERAKDGSILHIDELNRANEEFQALLFELSGEKEVTHPSGVTFSSTDRYAPPVPYGEGTPADPKKGRLPQFPVIIATINEGDVATVELSAALRRRFARVVFERPSVGTMVSVVRKTAGDDVVGRVAKSIEANLKKEGGVA